MTAISPYAQLEPCVWRRLLIRGAVFHAVRRDLGRLCEAAETAVVALVLTQLQMRTQETSDDLDDATAVARVVEAWDRDLGEVLDFQAVEEETQRLLADVRTGLGQARCTDPFREMFNAVERQARALYGPAWRPASLSLAHIRSHPRNARSSDDPYAVTATTALLDPAGRDEAEVELQIFTDRFGPAAFAAVPMLFTHECVCHVPARQDRVKNSSTFAEGLLDWAAYHFLTMWAVKLDREFGSTAREHADRLRWVLTMQNTSSEGVARRIGHEAARRLAVWFETECDMTPAESSHRVARLAVELNMVDRPLLVKEHLVSLLSAPPPKLAQDLRSWVQGTVTSEQILDSAAGP